MIQKQLGRWLIGFVILALLCTPRRAIAEGGDAYRPDGLSDVPLLRVFLQEGGSLVSVGEFARLEQQVVFLMPAGTTTENPSLQLVTIPADCVDWPPTDAYREAVRAQHYLARQAEGDYEFLTSQLGRALNDVGATADPTARLAILERVRATLAEWPSSHFGYRYDDVHEMVGMLDEVVADFRAATGTSTFRLALVAGLPPPKPFVPLMPSPGPQEAIEQMLTAARLTRSAVERMSLLNVSAKALDRDFAALPVEWREQTKESVRIAIAREMRNDRAYHALSCRMARLAEPRAANADVHGVASVFSHILVLDAAMGSPRPEAITALVADVNLQLDAARRLRLARDHWEVRLPLIRPCVAAIDRAFQRFAALRQPLEEIKALSGPSPATLATVRRMAHHVLGVTTQAPVEECATAQGLMATAVGLADRAAVVRGEAVRAGDLAAAWNASSAAAGALLLAARAESDAQAHLRSPQMNSMKGVPAPAAR